MSDEEFKEAGIRLPRTMQLLRKGKGSESDKEKVREWIKGK